VGETRREGERKRTLAVGADEPEQYRASRPPLLPKTGFGPENASAAPVLRGRRLDSGGLLLLEAAAIEPAQVEQRLRGREVCHRERSASCTVPRGGRHRLSPLTGERSAPTRFSITAACRHRQPAGDVVEAALVPTPRQAERREQAPRSPCTCLP
jgi:hypothetical protein